MKQVNKLLSQHFFSNNLEGFNTLNQQLSKLSKGNFVIGMEDTGHYHFNLLRYLLDKNYNVGLINPTVTDIQRKQQGSSNKNDKLDTITICDVLATKTFKGNLYRVTTLNNFEIYEIKQLTRQHHNLKEELNKLKNRLQKSIDVVFPEYNSLFNTKYGTVYMNILKQFPSAKIISNTDIRTLKKYFELKSKGNRISLTADTFKEVAKNSIGFPSVVEEINIKNLVFQIEPITSQIKEIGKKIEEFSIKTNSPILSIPGISHFSGTSILAEIGDISNFNKASQ